MLSKIFPFLLWFKGYDGEKARADLVAGITVAMVLILGAFVFVRFIQQSFISSATESEAPQCGNTEDTQGFQCMFLNADANDEEAIAAEVNAKSCVRNKCPGAKNYVCCPAAEE